MKTKSSWWKRGGNRAVPAHARSALAFVGPQGSSLSELLGDVTGRGAHRYAPSMVAWMRQQYEAALHEGEDYHTQARQALDCEQQSRVRAADIRHWLQREAGIEFDAGEALRNGVYFSPAETGTAEQGRADVTAFYAQQSADEFGEDAPLYGHWAPQGEAPAEAVADTREFVYGGGR